MRVLLFLSGLLWADGCCPSRTKQIIIIIVNKNDGCPGRDKAALQLADGKTIILDSAGNGELAQQGNVAVKNANGELKYETRENNAQNIIAFNTMTTPRGGQYKLTLQDGTRGLAECSKYFKIPGSIYW